MTSKHTSFRTLLTAGAILLIGIAIFLNRTVSNLGLGRFDPTVDEPLVTVAKICQGTQRDSDEIGRLGGEEFGVLLPETGAQSAMAVAERLRHAVEAQTGSATTCYGPVTVSIGVACRSAEHTGLDELIKAADGALYEAKRNGRNRVVMS